MARLLLDTIVAVSLSCSPIVALAGGADLSDEDVAGGAQGPSFFGFVREVGGAGINDAKVTAAMKGGALVTRTDILGVYKIPGLGQDVNADDVTISCAKEGYVQANLRRRPRANADAKDPIQVDCYLQKR
jgi:hypothetical protein